MSDDTLPRTALPCPAWCDLGHGHPFPDEDPVDGTVARSHSRDVAELAWRHPHEPGVTFTARLAVERLEKARTDGGPVIDSPGPVIGLCVREPCELTGPQARQLAAALLNAADAWDETC